MTSSTATLRGRALAEQLMQDTCTITRPVGQSTDTETGIVRTSYTTLYMGKCRFQQAAAAAAPQQVGGASTWPQESTLHLPMSAASIMPDDVVTCTTSALDPDLAGRTFRVRGTTHKTFLTARRHQIQEILA